MTPVSKLDIFINRLHAAFPSYDCVVNPHRSEDDPDITAFIHVLGVPPAQLSKVSRQCWELAFDVFGDLPIPFHLTTLDPEVSAEYFPDSLAPAEVSCLAAWGHSDFFNWPRMSRIDWPMIDWPTIDWLSVPFAFPSWAPVEQQLSHEECSSLPTIEWEPANNELDLGEIFASRSRPDSASTNLVQPQRYLSSAEAAIIDPNDDPDRSLAA